MRVMNTGLFKEEEESREQAQETRFTVQEVSIFSFPPLFGRILGSTGVGTEEADSENS